MYEDSVLFRGTFLRSLLTRCIGRPLLGGGISLRLGEHRYRVVHWLFDDWRWLVCLNLMARDGRSD